MNDTELLNDLESALSSRYGRIAVVNGWQIAHFPGGYMVAKSPIDDPLIEQCTLRQALRASLETPPPQ